MFFCAVLGLGAIPVDGLRDGYALFATMFRWTPGSLPAGTAFVLPMLAVAAWWAMIGPNVFEMRFPETWRVRAALTTGFAAALALIIGLHTSPFLYYQF